MTTDSGHVSWLALERYWLGELDDEERNRVERALEESAELRQRLDQIRSEQARPLRPLPDSVPRPSVASPLWKRRPIWRRPELWRGAMALAASLGAIVVGRNIWERSLIVRDDRPKGDLVYLELVKQSGDTDASVFAEGDIFKVRITCSRPEPVLWQVTVFQGNEVFSPLSSVEPVRCGNQVALPGAFRLTGTAPAIVCLGLAEAVVPPERLLKDGIRALPATAACTHVRPQPQP